MCSYRKRKCKAKKAVSLVCLALLCVGVCELLAFRHFSPVDYAQFSSNVYTRFHALTQMVSQRTSAVFTGFFTSDSEESEGAQAVGTPTIVELESAIDPSATQLRDVDGQEILTGGAVEFIYYNQTDAQWSEQPYGRDTIGPYGCGPVAMAMTVSSLKGAPITPDKMAAWAAEHGQWAKKSGSYLSIVLETARAFELSAEPFSARTPESIYETLLSGDVLVALMGAGHFTNKGHFIVLRGVSLGGMILVADPSSRARSISLWDAQLILDELSKSTAHGAPLWRISPPQV